MYRRGNVAAAIDKTGSVARMNGHHGRSAKESAEADLLAYLLADGGDNTHRRRLVVNHTDCRFVGNHRRNRRCGRVPGNRNHIQAHAANAGHRFQLIHVPIGWTVRL